jgi:FKBP-type peptidyl-prolyl cis-trans isomerase
MKIPKFDEIKKDIKKIPRQYIIAGSVVLVVIVASAGILIYNKFKTNSTSNNNMSTSSQTADSNIQKLPNGLIIEDQEIGGGDVIKSGDTISIDYVGTLQDGTKFDSSLDRGQKFTTKIGVGMVIPGWDQGIPGMREGGKRKLTIPAVLAYGDQALPGIPAGSTLIFEVQNPTIVK